MKILSYLELEEAANRSALELARWAKESLTPNRKAIFVHPVPRGGVPAFYLLKASFAKLWPDVALVAEQNPELADLIFDDLVDSGKTAQKFREIAPRVPFKALIHKTADGSSGYKLGEWLVFPWEGSAESSIEGAFTRLIQFVGEDPQRGGLLETPKRMAKAWQFWTKGYAADIPSILKTFEDGGEVYDEMIHVRNIPFYSQCEHHMALFFGTATFAYIPGKECKRIVGLSKMNRLVDAFARRLQVQERLTAQVIDTFCEHLNPHGAGIMIRARHMCVESRGVQHTGCETTTSAFRGALRDKPEARAEFFSLTK
jgi:GTP cyclohydrolase I